MFEVYDSFSSEDAANEVSGHLFDAGFECYVRKVADNFEVVITKD